MLPLSFYLNPDVVHLARELLGKRLCTKIGGPKTSGIITETEAYAGITDKASHAYGGRRTNRTEVMYGVGGTAYIYLCYGMYSLFNVVTNREGTPHAILIRGIEPDDGIDMMMKRRRNRKPGKNFSDGPGKVSEALGIHYSYSGLALTQRPGHHKNPAIWIEDAGMLIPAEKIIVTSRIGVDYAGEDAKLPYRFVLHNRGDLPCIPIK